MAISVDPATLVITIPQTDLTLVSGLLYELDVNAFRLSLKDWEDDPANMGMLDTHRHNTEVTISGVTYARTFEIINNYTVEFEDLDPPYTVRCVGANHNIVDVMNFNSVNLLIGNSAGLQTVVSGSGVTAQDKTDIIDGVWAKALETLTAEEMMRIMLAALAGKVNGAGTGTENFRDQADAKNRITSTVDGSGNRSNVVVDGT